MVHWNADNSRMGTARFPVERDGDLAPVAILKKEPIFLYNMKINLPKKYNFGKKKIQNNFFVKLCSRCKTGKQNTFR